MEPADFLATFVIKTEQKDSSGTVTNIYNDRTYFDFYYESYDYSVSQTPTRIEAILCKEYIMGP